ncbi:MAG TPA: C-terminal binding protein [Micromonosporaceae bacterium]|nr:C-terminal binding protein [Micromonosporaceae bacterium]
MSRPLAVYTDVADLDPAPGVQLLEEHGFQVRVLDTAHPDRIISAAVDAAVLLIGYSPVTAGMMARLPNLKLICTQSAGFDMVDVAAAQQHGIWVTNVPGAATEEVAAHALAMALGLLRGLPFYDRQVRAGRWDAIAEPLRRPSATTLGIIGMGRIGQRLAELASPLFGSVVGYDPLVPQRHWPDPVRRMEMAELLTTADVVSLHLPLTDTTHHLIGRDQLAAMRPGALLVNVSRGELVDHEALVEALDSGHLLGAALDVLPTEPPPADLPLLQHPRILFSPHAAYLSQQSAQSYVRLQAENAISWLRQGEPVHIVARGR